MWVAINMTSEAKRDPKTDNLLTPENSAFLLIDYQPIQINAVNSMPRPQLVDNVVNVTRLMNIYHVPVVLSTVKVLTGRCAKL